MQDPGTFVCWPVSKSLQERFLNIDLPVKNAGFPGSPSPFLVQPIWGLSRNLHVQVILITMVHP